MKTLNIRRALGGVMFAACIGIAQAADMIGDTLTFQRLYPDLNTNYVSPVTATVSAGNRDTVNVQSHATINPEANSITISFNNTSTFVGSSTVFDGYRFTGFSKPIAKAWVKKVTNLSATDLTIEQFDFSANQITLNASGTFSSTSQIVIQVEFSSSSSLVCDSASHASFDPVAGTLRIPFVDVPNVFGGNVTYSADLRLINGSPLQFQVIGAAQVSQ